jgi:hypothetical protein
MPPKEDDAIPIPDVWHCMEIEDVFFTIESPLNGSIEFNAPEILDRLKVGERYRLVLIPAYVTVATSDEPAPE